MIITACTLFIVSLSGAGFLTGPCYSDENKTVLIDHSPSRIIYVDELPHSHTYHEVERSYVTYWTTPSVRVVHRTYPSYRTYRVKLFKTRPHTHKRRVYRSSRRPTASTRSRRLVRRSTPRPRYQRRTSAKRSTKRIRRPSKRVMKRTKRSTAKRTHVSHRTRRPR